MIPQLEHPEMFRDHGGDRVVAEVTPNGFIHVGDKVTFKATKIKKVIEGEVVEIIPPQHLPSPELMEEIARDGKRSFNRCAHTRYAIRCDKTGATYIPYGASSVVPAPDSFRLNAYTLDDVAVLTKKKREVVVPERDIKELHRLALALDSVAAEMIPILQRIADRAERAGVELE
jgi:hypothetical protein